MTDTTIPLPLDSDYTEPIRYTADVVLLTLDGQVLLIKRGWDPHKDAWALAGGHADPGETSRQAAVRELREETGIHLEADALSLVGVYDAPGRDPRGRYVTVAYVAVVAKPIVAKAGDDAADVRWWQLSELPPLAFDHADIVTAALGVDAPRVDDDTETVWEAAHYDGEMTQLGFYFEAEQAREHCEALVRRESPGAELQWAPFDYGPLGQDGGAWELYEITGSTGPAGHSAVLTGYGVRPLTVQSAYVPDHPTPDSPKEIA
jgi:8-oxo-dGTP diphosphatase